MKQDEWEKLEAAASHRSLYRSFADWADAKPPAAKRAIWTAAGVSVAALAVCTLAFGVSQVAGDRGAGGVDLGSSPAAAVQDGASGAQAASPGPESAYSLASKFFGLERWTFLSSEATVESLRDDIYSKLLALGMADGSFVYTAGEWEAAEGGYVCWVNTIPGNSYYRVDVAAPEFAATLTPVDVTDVPGYEEPERSEANDAVTGRDNHAEEDPAEAVDLRDLSAGIPLSDAERLAEALPGTAARNAEDVLIPGVAEGFGFSADAALCRVFAETVEKTAGGCRFTCAFVDSQRNVLYLQIEYDEATGNYSGERIDR